MSTSNRFLLIKSWGCGFWSAMEHVSGELLIAELTDRTPVIFWGADSLYASDNPIFKDAFTMYFLPVSNYTIEDVINEHYTYYPSRWNRYNLRLPGAVILADLDDVPSRFSRHENVLVSSIHTALHYFESMINESHPVHGLGFEDKHRYIYNKYFKLQPYLSDEIEKFYLKSMKHKHPILGVHVRGSDKIKERPHLQQLNASYFPEIDSHLKNDPTASIFLLTDSEIILKKYKELYGDKIIHTDAVRTTDDNVSVHSDLPYCNKRQKGIDIIKDTYLALKCDHFIGASYSNVSLAISRLKDWSKGTITLIPE